MKIKCNKILFISALVLSSAFIGCGDSLLDDLNANTSVSGTGSDGLIIATNYEEAAGMFLTAQKKLHAVDPNTGQPHEYQAQCNLYIDNFAGYLAGTQNFAGNLPSTYRYYKDFAEGPKFAFFKVAQSTLPVIRSAEKLGLKEIGAMCSIMYCYAALELSDIYGPFPWWDYKMDKQESPLQYLAMNEIYDSLFVDLKKAGDVLKDFVNTPKVHRDSINDLLQTYDYIFPDPKVSFPLKNVGDSILGVENWRRFANTLRLRMAMRMTNVDPERAKIEAKLAYDDGLIEKTVAYSKNKPVHPLFGITQTWKDSRLNASMENIMKRMKYPLMDVIFQKNTDDIYDSNGKLVVPIESQFVGLKTGIPLTPRNDANQYTKYSPVSATFSNQPICLFRVSEMWFLLSEAELRWPGEVFGYDYRIQETYENGIFAAFEDYGIPATDPRVIEYCNSDENTMENYVDPFNSYYNEDGLVSITPKWDDGVTDAVKLEKIITQKWLTNFPNGLEAWNDLRRTGYPRIFVQKTDIGDGSIRTNKIIRRLPWDVSDPSLASDVATTGVAALGGPNLESTRLWWDVSDPSQLSDNDRF